MSPPTVIVVGGCEGPSLAASVARTLRDQGVIVLEAMPPRPERSWRDLKIPEPLQLPRENPTPHGPHGGRHWKRR